MAMSGMQHDEDKASDLRLRTPRVQAANSGLGQIRRRGGELVRLRGALHELLDRFTPRKTELLKVRRDSIQVEHSYSDQVYTTS